MSKKMSLRAAGVVVGLSAALAPAALLAYDATTDVTVPVVAQATATAAPKTTASPAAPKTGNAGLLGLFDGAAQAQATASPSAPKTGNAGLAGDAGTAAVAATLAVLAVGVVAGGRVLASRRG